MGIAVAVALFAYAPRSFTTESEIQAFAVSPDGTRVVCARDGNWYDVYDARTGAKLVSGRASDGDQIGAFAFSPDGKTLAGGVRETNTVWLWDAATGDQLPAAAANPTGVRSLAFSPDGRTIASGGESDGIVNLLDSSKRTLTASFREGDRRPGPLGAIAFHPSGRYLGVGGADGATLWKVEGGPRPVHTLTNPADAREATAVAFLPSSRSAVVAAGGQVRMVELATGKPRWQNRVSGRVAGLVVSPDGRLVAGLEMEATGGVALWDADTGASVATLRAQKAGCVGIAAAGGMIFAAGDDKTVRVRPWPAVTPRVAARIPLAERESLASALNGDDAVRAFAAVKRLTGDPSTAVELAKVHFQPIALPTAGAAERVHGLIHRLGSDDFDERQTASDELAKLGAAVVPQLRRALRQASDPEVNYRLSRILDSFDHGGEPADPAAARWLEVLERVGTPAALSVVKAVAAGDPDQPRTADAQDTFTRLSQRR